jgi:hypothetical protein
MATSKPARTFEDLRVWQKAHRFVLAVYGFTATFPKHEIYGLSLQAANASGSGIDTGQHRRGIPPSQQSG